MAALGGGDHVDDVLTELVGTQFELKYRLVVQV
jgi:hypothetical protein